MRWVALLLLYFSSATACGNAGDCYWLIAAKDGSDPFTIRVVYDSGHTATFGVGDYLPFGCNVHHYEIAGIGVDGGGMRLLSPACRPDATALIGAPGWMQGQPYPIYDWMTPFQAVKCNGCGSCNTPPPPGGGGQPDTDGDGIPDVDDPDDDNDGIPDNQDDDDDGNGTPDEDENDDDPDDGCSPGDPGYPNCDEWEENPCRPGYPGYPDCGEYGYGWECDPCPKLDAILGILGRWDDEGLPVDLGSPSGSTPQPTAIEVEQTVETYPIDLPDVNLSGSLTAWNLAIPMPGGTQNYRVGVRPVEDFLQSQLPAGSLLVTVFTVDTIRQVFRLLALTLVTWNFVKHVFRLFVSM